MFGLAEGGMRGSTSFLVVAGNDLKWEFNSFRTQLLDHRLVVDNSYRSVVRVVLPYSNHPCS